MSFPSSKNSIVIFKVAVPVSQRGMHAVVIHHGEEQWHGLVQEPVARVAGHHGRARNDVLAVRETVEERRCGGELAEPGVVDINMIRWSESSANGGGRGNMKQCGQPNLRDGINKYLANSSGATTFQFSKMRRGVKRWPAGKETEIQYRLHHGWLLASFRSNHYHGTTPAHALVKP
uniref:Uncharacterized protein n=1 Tax=Oryza punctata TaxID=4537 RepID=A0A0E0LQS8_ORYPU